MKKIIAVLLSLALVFGMVSISAFAVNEPLHYVVLGDSIAYGSGLSNPVEACYGKIVADTNGYTYANHAIPGHTTTNLINRLSQEEVIEDIKKADIINISIGGNDFLLGNLLGLLFSYIIFEDETQIIDTTDKFYENFTTIVETINSYNEDAVILIQTIYNPQFNSLSDPYLKAGSSLNEAMEKFDAENPGEIIIVDVASALNGDEGNFASDGIHPSSKGNEIIACEVLKNLEANDLGNETVPVINVKGEDIQVSPLFTMPFEVLATIFYGVNYILSLIGI